MLQTEKPPTYVFCSQMMERAEPEVDAGAPSSGHPVTDETEVLLAQLMQESYTTVTAVTADEEYLELRYTVNAAKFAYQPHGGSWLAEPLLPREGEHLCVRNYAATGPTQTVVQRDDALLTPDEVQKHWPEVAVAIKQELETWVTYGCISRMKRKLARNIINVKWVTKWKFEQEARNVQESQRSGPSATR